MTGNRARAAAVDGMVTVATARLKTLYETRIVPELKQQLGLKNAHEVPRLQKIVISVGLGRYKDDKKVIEAATNTLRKITGQQPIETVARKSIAGFKLRAGSKIGLKTTLRGGRMYEFMDRLINVVLPRLRDFRGLSPRAFDASGNYSLGIPEQSVFPELTFEETTTVHGLQITFVVDHGDHERSRALLEQFGMPFEKDKSI